MISEHLIEESLSLPVNDRAALADLLLRSLNQSDNTQIVEAWVKEAAQRDKDFSKGKIDSAPISDVVQRLKSRLS